MNTARKHSWKRLAGILAALLLLVALSGCSGGNTEAPAAEQPAESAPETTAYTFEAEYADLTDKAGAGPSNAAFETEMVLADTAASNGHYIGYTYFTDLFFDYVITADAAADATLKIVFGSDLGPIKLGPGDFEISVNETAIEYDAFRLADSSGKVNKVFKEETIGTIALTEGENTIRLKILQNELYNGGSGGPLIDCIIMETSAKLEWNPVEANID